MSVDELVARLILQKLRARDAGWSQGYEPPEHFAVCPDVEVTETETRHELWFDTGVDATRLIATLACPHQAPYAWEWADLGELPDMLADLEALR